MTANRENETAKGDEGQCPSRRHVLLTASAAIALPGLFGARVEAVATGDGSDYVLRYGKPAAHWVEALPLGNGRLGAMAFGRVKQDRLQINEDTLWSGSPYDPINPDAADALPKVRALIAQGKCKEAADLASAAVMAKPLQQMPYASAGDVFFDFRGLKRAEAFDRTLDLDSAVAETRFSDGTARHRRTAFASVPDRVLVYRTESRGGTQSFDIGYRAPAPIPFDEPKYDPAALAAGTIGAPWDIVEATGDTPQTLGAPDGADSLLIEGSNAAASGIPAGLRYAVRIKVVGDGTIRATADRIEVRGAKAATVLIAAATSYVDFDRIDGDPVAKVRAATEAAARKSYQRLKADHMAEHRRLFRRLSLRLGPPASDRRPTPARIAAAQAATAPDAALAALYVQYGRYLMISSSRPGTQPANLQGIWNGSLNPAWGSKYTININTEMNYWPVDAANIGECFEPLLHMTEQLAVSGARTAKAMYRARGWVAHHNTDLWRATAPIDGPLWGLWPTGGAWLCTTLWDHYAYAPDQAYLARLYPLMKGACQFFLDTLVAGADGRLMTSPSLSPEHEHHPGVALCAGPAMDQQILRDLFAATREAQTLIGDNDRTFAAALTETRTKLAPDKIGAQGQFQEWQEDWDAAAPEQTHRHVSHLYAVYPSEQVNVRDTPALIEAAKTTLKVRGDISTGWATAWRLCLWARMGDGEHAHAILKGLLGPSRTYPNMFDAHPPFQIDGNFGGTAGILEMLVQSWGGEIRLLPALPAAWSEGRIEGIRAKGGIELDMTWKNGRVERTALRGQPGAAVKLREGASVRDIVLDGRGRWFG